MKTSRFTIKGLLAFGIIFLLSSSKPADYKASMAGWLVDAEKAQELSEKTGKPILANFTGTDWCGWCIRLKREVFTTPRFKEWAKENVVLLEVDFPRRFKLPDNIAQQNAGLQQAFQVTGYPTIWVFDLEDQPETGRKTITPLAKVGYIAGGPQAWLKDVKTKMAAARKQLNN